MKYAVMFLVIFSGLLLQSCNKGNTVTIDTLDFPVNNVSYQNHVQPFMQFTCSFQGCHSEYSQAGGRNLSDYYSITVLNLGLVVPGNPDGSMLNQILEGKLPHNPYLYWNIKDNHKKGVRQWVKEGAKNN